MFGWTPVVPRQPSARPRTAEWAGLHRARTEAARRGDRFVGTQHLLLALLSGDEVRDVLADAGVDLLAVETALAGIRGSGARAAQVPVDEVALSARAATVLARATDLRLAELRRAEAGAPDPGAVAPGVVEPGAVEPGAVEPGAIEPGAVAPRAVAGRAPDDQDVLRALLDSDDPALGRLVLQYIGARRRVRDALDRRRV